MKPATIYYQYMYKIQATKTTDKEYEDIQTLYKSNAQYYKNHAENLTKQGYIILKDNQDLTVFGLLPKNDK